MLLASVIVPFWTSFLVRTYSWVNLLQTDGPVNRLAFGITGHHLEVLYSPTSIGIGMVYSYLPLMVLPIYVSTWRWSGSTRICTRRPRTLAPARGRSSGGSCSRWPGRA